jgi:hypothetical protein
MWSNQVGNNVITIDLSPIYHQDFNEDVAHENVFRWRSQDGDNFNRQQTTTLTRVLITADEIKEKPQTKWSNSQEPIDVTGMSSLHRILLIRDITQRLREMDESREIDDKLLTGNSSTEIYFNLDGVQFSLGLNPTKDQPGNALLTMQGPVCGIFKDLHKSIEEFECFGKLSAQSIDLIVTRARQMGKRITSDDIISESYYDDDAKMRMAEQLTFFMLIYDFEIARRLQRPFVNNSQRLDSLPIGIGIAFNHLLNKKRGKDYRWVFFSCLFQSKPASRKEFLDEIIAAFKEWDESEKMWTHSDLIQLLYDHFGAPPPPT